MQNLYATYYKLQETTALKQERCSSLCCVNGGIDI